MTTKDAIKAYVAENFLCSNNGFNLSDDTSLLDAGIVDSTGVLELVLFVEERFAIQVLDNEIVPDNFDSINNLTRYIEQKKAVGTYQ